MRDRDGSRSRHEQDHERPTPPPSDPPDRARPSGRDDRLDRVRDADEIGRRADRMRIEEREHPEWGHTYRKHVLINDRQLEERANTPWVDSRGRVREPPVHATRWQSAEATVLAVDGLEHSAEYSRKKADAEARGVPVFEVRRPLSEVVGPEWRNDVYGRSRASDGRQPSRWQSDGNAFAQWRRQSDGRWHLYTCYPEPENYGWAGR